MTAPDNIPPIKNNSHSGQVPATPDPADHGGHKWKDIGGGVKKALSGVKGTFSNMNQKEKDCLMAAAAVAAIVALIIALLTFIFGFGAFGIIFLAVAPLFFTASIPIYMFRRSRERLRAEPTKGEIEKNEQLKKKIELSREAHHIENAKKREKWLTAHPS